LKDAPNPGLATKFVDLLSGDYGQKALTKAGFAKP
jgi:molybdate transport system substrate-binding protein